MGQRGLEWKQGDVVKQKASQIYLDDHVLAIETALDSIENLKHLAYV